MFSAKKQKLKIVFVKKNMHFEAKFNSRDLLSPENMNKTNVYTKLD